MRSVSYLVTLWRETYKERVDDYSEKHGDLPKDKRIGVCADCLNKLLGVEGRHIAQKELFGKEHLNELTAIEKAMMVFWLNPTKGEDGSWAVRAEAINFARRIIAEKENENNVFEL